MEATSTVHPISFRRHLPPGSAGGSVRNHRHLLEEGENRRIEVLVSETPDGKRQVLLQDLSHGPGVGWYVQKTIALDAAHVDALLRSLCCVRHPGSQCPLAAGAEPERAAEESDAADGVIVRIRDFAPGR